MSLATKRVVLAWLGAGLLAAVGCAAGPTSPSAITPVSRLAATASDHVALSVSGSSLRSGALHVTKECSAYTGQAHDFCTITSSDLKEIEVGSRVVYVHAADFLSSPPSLDSDVVLNLPGPGNNTAFGHCHLNFATGSGLCMFSGGTGKFTSFDASVDVSPPTDGVNWHWTGTYSFSPRD